MSDHAAQLDLRLREFQQEIAAARSEQSIRDCQARFLGKKGSITQLTEQLGKMAKEERPVFGRELNRVKSAIEAEVEKRLLGLAEEARAEDLRRQVDVTLPGRRRRLGRRHPISQVWNDLLEIFGGLGFSLAEGPEIELDWNNFEALNMPADHPARQMQDTFYVAAEGQAAESVLLRTHTSPVQIRTMRAQPPPVKIIAPGRVYRRDDDPTHSPMFFQIEGLYIDRHVTMAHLKGTILHFVQRFFGESGQVRFRPSFFPFVEPGAEMDMSCTHCGGRGQKDLVEARSSASSGATVTGAPCRSCKTTGWMEIGGAGMVHPRVLQNVGYDPREVSGFAFGMGLDRMAMLRYGVPDIKLFFEGDVRFLSQF